MSRNSKQAFTTQSMAGSGRTRIPGLNFQANQYQIQQAFRLAEQAQPDLSMQLARIQRLSQAERAVLWSVLSQAFAQVRDEVQA